MSTGTASPLRQMLAQQMLIRAPGVYDGITARLAADAGFRALYMTGAGVSASRGYPDYGLITMSEMVEAAGIIVNAAGDVPLISDSDTGYGNELNVTRTVREFEARGVAAIHIEDQVSPKRCGHLEGKELVSRDEFASKIAAASRARRSADFVIIARSDAIAVAGVDEAIDRVNAALTAGADMAFVEAPPSAEVMADIPKRVNGPCLINLVAGGKTPILPPEELQALGYRVAIYPAASLLPIVQSVDRALADLNGQPASDMAFSPGEFFGRFGSGEWDRLRMTAGVSS